MRAHHQVENENVREKGDEVRCGVCVRLIICVVALSLPPDGHI